MFHESRCMNINFLYPTFNTHISYNHFGTIPQAYAVPVKVSGSATLNKRTYDIIKIFKQFHEKIILEYLSELSLERVKLSIERLKFIGSNVSLRLNALFEFFDADSCRFSQACR